MFSIMVVSFLRIWQIFKKTTTTTPIGELHVQQSSSNHSSRDQGPIQTASQTHQPNNSVLQQLSHIRRELEIFMKTTAVTPIGELHVQQSSPKHSSRDQGPIQTESQSHQPNNSVLQQLRQHQKRTGNSQENDHC